MFVNLHDSFLRKVHYYSLCFTDEETEAPKSLVTYPQVKHRRRLTLRGSVTWAAWLLDSGSQSRGWKSVPRLRSGKSDSLHSSSFCTCTEGSRELLSAGVSLRHWKVPYAWCGFRCRSRGTALTEPGMASWVRVYRLRCFLHSAAQTLESSKSHVNTLCTLRKEEATGYWWEHTGILLLEMLDLVLLTSGSPVNSPEHS